MKTIDKQLANQPKEVKFCTKCVMSNQRPRITFDENGVCSACNWAEEKKVIDWSIREDELDLLCTIHRRDSGFTEFDCVVGVSGGKDSAFIAHTLKHKYGMHPLCVSWAPFMLTDIGRINLENFIHSGFTVIQASPNGELHRKLARISLQAVGDPFQVFSYGQVAFPMHIAKQFGISLVFCGEEAELEYGGTQKNKDHSGMPDKDQTDLFFKGADVDDILGYGVLNGQLDDIDESDLMFYRPPAQTDNLKHYYLGHFLKWNPHENVKLAKMHTGFQESPTRTEGTYSKYASLDDKLDGLHYYLSYIKFGIGRATSDAAHEIRDGVISREEGVELVRRYDGEFPTKYLQSTLSYLGISATELHKIIDSYRPEHLWESVGGFWKLKHSVYNA